MAVAILYPEPDNGRDAARKEKRQNLAGLVVSD